jgi:hypothetical protein
MVKTAQNVHLGGANASAPLTMALILSKLAALNQNKFLPALVCPCPHR